MLLNYGNKKYSFKDGKLYYITIEIAHIQRDIDLYWVGDGILLGQNLKSKAHTLVDLIFDLIDQNESKMSQATKRVTVKNYTRPTTKILTVDEYRQLFN